MIWKIIRAVSGLGGWIGWVYIPADVWGICDAYPLMCAKLASVDRFQGLAAFSGLLVAWIIYRDWREPVIWLNKWWSGKRRLYSVEYAGLVTPNGNLTIRHPQALVRFHKSAREVEITIHVREISSDGTERVFLADQETLLDIKKDQTHQVNFGTWWWRCDGPHTKTSNESFWAADPAKRMHVNAKHLITMSLNGRDHRFLCRPQVKG